MQTRDEKMDRLGKAGELIVGNHYISKGHIVEFSVDPFDREKDMLVDDDKHEVKTQVPFISKDAFSFRENQLKKILNSHTAVFVSVPAMKVKHHSDGKVYTIDPKKLKYYSWTTSDGRKMILVPIRQEYMVELFTMTEKDSKILQAYSVSEWNR